MPIRHWATTVAVVLCSLAFGHPVSADSPVDAKKLLSQPKTYVGSEVCRNCHLEHYDAWKRTLHSRMLQDAKVNQDAIITEIDPEQIKADLTAIQDKLKVTVDQVYIPAVADIRYTIGNQWKQRYLVEKDGEG